MTGRREPDPELIWHNKNHHLLMEGAGKYEWVGEADPRRSDPHYLRRIGSFGSAAVENLLIHGDARHALNALADMPGYVGSVKMAYLDPPFNKGYAHAHYGDRVSHSVWLAVLRDCLTHVKELLAEDGSVWVHLDDSEQHRARVVMDEVFGPEQFVSTVIWDRTKNPRTTVNALSVRHDYIHIYRKSPSFSIRPLKIEAGKQPRRAHTLWECGDVGSGREAMAESRRLFGEPFATPKPERLLARAIALASDPGDVVLDCFAGSGTTPAVAHKLNRRWVAVEVQEATVCDFLQERLARVIAGTDCGGATQDACWTGGGGFTRFDVEQSRSG